MSYEIGALPGRRLYARRERRALPGCAAVRNPRGTPVSLPAEAETLGDLGFSLKPPKWLRKAQPGKILAKAAIPIAIGAALLIPGVGAAAVGAGGALIKGAGSFFGGAARMVGNAGRAVGNVVTADVLPALIPGAKSSGIMLPKKTPDFGTAFNPADNTMPATVTQPAAPPGAAAAFQTSQVAASQGGMTFNTPEAAAASVAAPAVNPALIIGALAVGALMLTASKKRG